MNKVAIFSVPRSGSSWLGQIFNSHPNVEYKFQPNFAYSFNYSLTENSSKFQIKEFYEQLIKTQDHFVNAEITISTQKGLQFKKETASTLVFKETHYINVLENLLQNSETRIIGLVRSPFAVINSWVKIPKEFNPEWSIKEEWKDGSKKNQNRNYNFFGFNKWKEATKLFLRLQKEFPEKFKILNYSDLLDRKEEITEDIFSFCSLEFSDQTKLFLNQSNKIEDADAYSVFKKKDNDDGWKDELPNFIIEEIMGDKEFQELNKIFRWI